uniref:Uncharacterized protein n=1 Tax=Arundo donax TaxID=35708 RepID=A0A0A9F8R1_ARUDO
MRSGLPGLCWTSTSGGTPGRRTPELRGRSRARSSSSATSLPAPLQ